jgi:hypothetical protein
MYKAKRKSFNEVVKQHRTRNTNPTDQGLEDENTRQEPMGKHR